jgi:hypothetical protein
VHRNRRQLANSPGTVTETRVNVSFLTERTERGSGDAPLKGKEPKRAALDASLHH